jgi:hypothetical protein
MLSRNLDEFKPLAKGLPPLKLPVSSKPMSITAVLPYPALKLRLFAMSFIFLAGAYTRSDPS